MEALQDKLAHEGERIELEMKRRSEEYWTSKWKLELELDPENENNDLFRGFITDARRNVLRSVARPLQGCKCGSMNHEFVNDPKCVLYRDVKAFCAMNSIAVKDGGDSRHVPFKNKKSQNALEAAYVERFMKLRAESQATKEEAEFVLEMEKKQTRKMKMAVFAPSTLCTMVLSAVASVMEHVTEEGPQMNGHVGIGKTVRNDEYPIADEEDDGDEDDIPLNTLLLPGSLKRATASSMPSSAKRSKQIDPRWNENDDKPIPSPYFLAEILKHISHTYGHLFQEPSHVEFAW